MEFLVTSTLALPAGLPPDEREELLRLEGERGRQLRDRGAIARIWRLRDRPASVAIWRATDREELDELLASLPVARWLSVEVEALAPHYLEHHRDGSD